jgi:hypothetical protein
MTRVFRRLHLFRFLVFVMGFERPLPRCHGPRTTVKSCTRVQFPAGPPPSMSGSTFSPTLLMAGDTSMAWTVGLLRNKHDHGTPTPHVLSETPQFSSIAKGIAQMTTSGLLSSSEASESIGTASRQRTVSGFSGCDVLHGEKPRMDSPRGVLR